MTLNLPSRMKNIRPGIAANKEWHNYRSPHTGKLVCNCEDTLYQHLDIEALMKTFNRWLYQNFKITRVDFCLPELEITLALSRPLADKIKINDRLQYDLNHHSKSLGNLKLFRQQKFSAFERTNIDAFVKKLCGPLYNAIRYAHACRSGYRDALTGLYNRAAMEAFLFDTATAKDRKITAMLVCDTDRFKCINDHYGHTVGDEILKKFSNELTTIVKGKGSVYRYGGDEFVVALESATNNSCVALAEEIRTATTRCVLKDGTPLTTTIGATTVNRDDCLREAFSRADSALLTGKGAGSNKVVWYKQS